MIVLAELQPLDPVLGTRKTLRACSANDPRVTGLNDLIWKPAISGEPTIGIRLFKGDFDGTSAPSGGSLNIQIDQFERASIEPNVRRFVWAGASVKLWAGNAGDAWPWTQVFEGSVSSFDAEGNQVRLQTKSNQEPFDVDALSLKYAGTGGIEGGVDLKDKPKPFLLGRCFSVEPVLINAVDNVYQVSGYGQIEAVTKLYERASDFGTSSGDHASYAALVAATIPAGSWATCLASGLIRLGAPAYGLITADVDGDKAGGTWRRKTGEIILRIADNAGVSSAVIEAASFTAIDTALSGLPNQGRIGIYITDQTSVLDIASRLAAPCNAQVGVSLLGKMFASRISIGVPSMTLDAQQRQLPRVVSSVEQSVSPPYSLIEMGYALCWRVHSEDEIAAADLSPTSQYPAPPPTNPIIGHIYINSSGQKFRFDGRALTFGGEALTFNGEPILTSGYSDAQDQLTVTAAATANAAAADADAALAALAAIDDDGIITISEKVETLIPAAAALEALYTAVSANAATAGVSVTTLNAKRTAWLAELSAILPAWNDISQPSPVTRNALDTARDEYDSELKSVQKLAIEQMTMAQQITTDIAGGVLKKIAADYTGAVTGSYPTFAPVVLRNGVSIKADGLVTYTATKLSDASSGADGGTISLSGSGSTKGDVTPSAFASLSSVIKWRLTISYDGIEVSRFDCTLEKEIGAPPVSGNKLATVSANTSQSTTTYAACHSAAAPQLVVASGESLHASGALTYESDLSTGARSGTFKNQYSSDGSSWTDFGSAINGSNARAGRYIGDDWIDPVIGSVDIAQSVTPSAGTYYVRTVWVISSTGATLYLGGNTITFEAKV